jgi:hypothetical protein
MPSGLKRSVSTCPIRRLPVRSFKPGLERRSGVIPSWPRHEGERAEELTFGSRFDMMRCFWDERRSVEG